MQKLEVSNVLQVEEKQGERLAEILTLVESMNKDNWHDVRKKILKDR